MRIHVFYEDKDFYECFYFIGCVPEIRYLTRFFIGNRVARG